MTEEIIVAVVVIVGTTFLACAAGQAALELVRSLAAWVRQRHAARRMPSTGPSSLQPPTDLNMVHLHEAFVDVSSVDEPTAVTPQVGVHTDNRHEPTQQLHTVDKPPLPQRSPKPYQRGPGETNFAMVTRVTGAAVNS